MPFAEAMRIGAREGAFPVEIYHLKARGPAQTGAPLADRHCAGIDSAARKRGQDIGGRHVPLRGRVRRRFRLLSPTVGAPRVTSTLVQHHQSGDPRPDQKGRSAEPRAHRGRSLCQLATPQGVMIGRA